LIRSQASAPVRPSVAKRTRWRYRSHVTVNPVAGFGDPSENKAHMRPKTIAGAFFVPAVTIYGGCAWEGFGPAGFLVSRFANLRTAATLDRLATIRGGSTKQGAVPMTTIPTPNPSALRDRAAAHRAMALAALRADSSLSVRLRRYNAAMTKARALEAEAERQQTTTTRDPRTALAWLQSGRPVRIDALNLRDHLRHVRALADLQAREAGGAQ
jgi:hypothetical protein